MLALAAALQIWTLGAKNIWDDEAVSWFETTQSVPALVATTANDVHPPLYYLVLKAWVHVAGRSLAGMRSLSVAASLVALALLAALAFDALPAALAIAAVFWCAVSPHTIYYAQEARMYAPVEAAVLGMVLGYRRWVDSRFESRSALAWYAVWVVIAIYMHYFAVFVVAAIWVHAAILTIVRPRSSSRPHWRAWLIAHAAIAAAYAPWLSSAVRQTRAGQAWRTPVGIMALPHEASHLVRMLVFGPVGTPQLFLPQVMIALLVLGAGLIACAVRAIGRRDERALCFGVVAIAPLLMGLALVPMAGHLNLDRYLAYALPLVVLASIYGWAAVRIPRRAAATLVVVAALMPIGSLRRYYATPTKDFDPQPIVDYLEQAARHGGRQDAILVAPAYFANVADYDAHGALTVQPLIWPADFEPAIAALAGRPAWLVVEYRWPRYNELAADRRLVEVPIAGVDPARVRLYRIER